MRHLRMIIVFLILVWSSPYKLSALELEESTLRLEIKELYLPYAYSMPREQEVTHIVIHSLSNVVANPENPYQLVDLYLLLMEYGVSTHYLINRDGEIYQLVSENRVAFHAGRSSFPYLPFFPHSLNEYSIGIELMGIGTREEMLPFVSEEIYDSLHDDFIGYTEVQYRALSRLLNDIHKRYPTIPRSRNHVIGHEDYAPGRKVDPGKLFDWEKINY
ncbi:N-acetylmuramoyl-L-alanine amidase [Ornithinibacillus sp. BX22]|uniref:N-acetylmuramoyl-L-alanine amidase n=1 Tax=Ornithinibacillus hominis TaxID=2763055 RepID=A0A923L4D9_9BACI|nr:N-acetylmuramoyl-L-alanine amidase [Ornithinibacillus hominis]MBC5636196.1 N-acetylmuramoyl-L-alanine amidase [Ornithinibacillus hominis]